MEPQGRMSFFPRSRSEIRVIQCQLSSSLLASFPTPKSLAGTSIYQNHGGGGGGAGWNYFCWILTFTFTKNMGGNQNCRSCVLWVHGRRIFALVRSSHEEQRASLVMEKLEDRAVPLVLGFLAGLLFCAQKGLRCMYHAPCTKEVPVDTPPMRFWLRHRMFSQKTASGRLTSRRPAVARKRLMRTGLPSAQHINEW